MIRVRYTAACPSCGQDTTFESVGQEGFHGASYMQTKLVRIDVLCKCGGGAE